VSLRVLTREKEIKQEEEEEEDHVSSGLYVTEKEIRL